MSRNTSVVLGSHFERFIAKQLKTGRFESKSEVVRAGMRLLEERERKVAALRRAIVEGEESGPSVPFSIDEIIAEAQSEADQSRPPSSDA